MAQVDGPPADVFSLGITLFALLFGSLPWTEPSMDNSDYAAFVRRYEDMHGSRSGMPP
jgi:serine/threonine protein kinase